MIMKQKFIAVIIAVVVAVVIYFGGWEIIKFFGNRVFGFPWSSWEILALSAMTLGLILYTAIVPCVIYNKIVKIAQR